MADIFISYAREDESRIQPLARALEERGLSVFWDRRIPSGQTWRGYIGQALSDASRVIVAWSRHSISSNWVTEEADEGKKRGVLVPILLDPVEPPLGFRSIQAADLTDWTPAGPSPRFEQLLGDIDLVRKAPQRPIPGEQVAESERSTSRQRKGRPRQESQRFSRRYKYALAAVILVLREMCGYTGSITCFLWRWRGRPR